jgi:ribosome-binding protein aMBF1 (putative translation factor)
MLNWAIRSGNGDKAMVKKTHKATATKATKPISKQVVVKAERQAATGDKAKVIKLITDVRERHGLSNRELAGKLEYSYWPIVTWQRADLPNLPPEKVIAKLEAMANPSK